MPQSVIQDLISIIEFKEPKIVELKDKLFEKNGLQVSMLRLDEIHPVIV
jgi:hypothetical protein